MEAYRPAPVDHSALTVPWSAVVSYIERGLEIARSEGDVKSFEAKAFALACLDNFALAAEGAQASAGGPGLPDVMTSTQIADALGMSRRTAQRYIRSLRNARRIRPTVRGKRSAPALYPSNQTICAICSLIGRDVTSVRGWRKK